MILKMRHSIAPSRSLLPINRIRYNQDSRSAARVIGERREVMGQRKDGSIFPIDIHLSEMVLGNQRLFTGILSDSTERKRAEQLRQEKESAEIAN